jgi:DNA-binding PadR family transcriptional regulator
MSELLPLPPPVFHILIALWDGEKHGYAIMQDVRERTGGSVKMGPGTLYGSIKRMLELGLMEEIPSKAVKGDERRRVYRITKLGRQTAQAEARRLAEVLEQARSYGLVPKQA